MRSYANGTIPITPNRRERHNTDGEILISRFVDRALRPLFPKGLLTEVQLTITSHATDGVNDPGVAAVNASSFALFQANYLQHGPVGCVRIGLLDDKLVVNPSVADMKNSRLNFLYAGTLERVLM